MAPNVVKFARAQTINYGRRAEGAPNGLNFAHGQTLQYGRRMGGHQIGSILLTRANLSKFMHRRRVI